MEITCDLGVHATYTDYSSWSGQTMIDCSRNINFRGFLEKAERSNCARILGSDCMIHEKNSNAVLENNSADFCLIIYVIWKVDDSDKK